MKSFWLELPKPFTILSPMEGVTDTVFRQIVLQTGRPDVFFTEFTNCDGMMSKGRDKVSMSLKFEKSELPIVAQIWGSNPDTFCRTAKYCREKGFSGIDINMGCPDKVIIKKGSCAALIRNPKLAKEIILATKEGAEDLPVSVKTRLGFELLETEEWLEFLFEQDLSALTVHLRTVGELSKVPARWEYMPKIINLRNEIAPKTLVIGNGDIKSLSEVKEKYEKYKCDGFMIGRGIFDNPWLFNKEINIENITVEDRLNLYVKHIKLFDGTWKNEKNPANLKKFGKTYINNFSDASILREKVMRSKDISEMLERISGFKKKMDI